MRDHWADFIARSPARAYLYTRGRAEIIPYEDDQDPLPDDVSEFLRSLRGELEVSLLGQLYLVLHPETQNFVFHDLPRLVRSLTHVSASTIGQIRGAVRGKILWGRTLKSRLAGDGDSGTFVIQDPSRSANRPENQLLKFVLTELSAVVDQTIRRVGRGRLPDALRAVGEEVDRALSVRAMHGVDGPRRPTALMKRLAYRHRDRRYGSAADLATQLENLKDASRWELTRDLLLCGWLSPLSDDDLFELYALTLTLEVLTEQLNFDVSEHGLVRAGRREVALLERPDDGASLQIFFDQSPDSIRRPSSRYRQVVREHSGLEGSGRRPDITMVLRDANDDVRWLLMEVKKSSDGPYMRDSVYKAFGYLWDFGGLFTEEELSHGPALILLFPSGVSPVAPPARGLRLVSSDDEATFVETLREAVE